jgi:hypothetical protein
MSRSKSNSPKSAYKAALSKRLPPYVSLHNFSTSSSTKFGSDYFSLTNPTPSMRTSTPHVAPHDCINSSIKRSAYLRPFRRRSHTIGTPQSIGFPLNSGRHKSIRDYSPACSDQSSLLTRSFSDGESLSGLSCLDQESPITNKILISSTSALTLPHSSVRPPIDCSIESYDDLLSSSTFRSCDMPVVPKNKALPVAVTHDQGTSVATTIEMNVPGISSKSSDLESDCATSELIKLNDPRRIDAMSTDAEQPTNLHALNPSCSCSIQSLNVLHNQRIMIRSLLRFAVQVFIPLSICGFGNMAAGILLDRVQQLRVFDVLSELYIAIPCLMGLKGNLEMTMVSRLSTAVSLLIFFISNQILSAY